MVSLKLLEILEVAGSCPLPWLVPHALKVAHTTCPPVLRPFSRYPHAVNTTLMGEQEKVGLGSGEGLPLHTLPTVILPRQ